MRASTRFYNHASVPVWWSTRPHGSGGDNRDERIILLTCSSCCRRCGSCLGSKNYPLLYARTSSDRAGVDIYLKYKDKDNNDFGALRGLDLIIDPGILEDRVALYILCFSVFVFVLVPSTSQHHASPLLQLYPLLP